MSVQAVSWALEQQVVQGPTARLVLICLANYAGEDGRNAFPSVKRLSEHTGLSRKSVQANLRKLEEIGIIEKGDQEIVEAHIKRGDRRPTNYNLPIKRGVTDAPRDERGVDEDLNGAYLTTQRGVPATPDPSGSVIEEPSHTRPDKQSLDDEFETWYSEYPRHQDKGHARKAYKAARKKAGAKILLEAARQASIKYRDTEKRYVPLPATWLNGERWLDEDVDTMGEDHTSKVSYQEWHLFVDVYRFKGETAWPKGKLGPPPDTPGCKAPPEILQEFGYSAHTLR